jgi:phosphinothricin tripeptide acetyl hydrolase
MSGRGIAVVRAHLARIPPADTLAERRAQYDRADRVFVVPPDTTVTTVAVPGAAEWIEPAGARADAAILYLHGGGYVLGSPRSHRHLAAAIGRAARARVLLADYRLAPEHRFPAAVEDAVTAYRWLLDRGHAPGRTALAGDSAGGGLVVATLLALRDRGLALPAAGVAISPWVDLTGRGVSYRDKAASDPIVARDRVMEMAQAYLGPADPHTPLASPLFADLTGLPPLLIQVGSEEVLLDDAVGLAERAKAAGVAATLEVWPEMIHVWHWFLPWLDEAEAAVATIGAFVQSSTS